MSIQNQFKRTIDAHCTYEQCVACGHTMTFTANARPEQIAADKAAHVCDQAAAA